MTQPHTERVAIAGTDGTGKTTVIHLLREAYAQHPSVLQAMRAPQYHDGAGLPAASPVRRLSAIIDAVSELADTQGNPGLKATALFLSMTLYGEVDRFYVETYHPRWLVNERQCLADSLVYAKFYLPLVQSALDPALEPALRLALAPHGPDALDTLMAYVPTLMAREGLPVVDLWHLPLYARDLFNTPPQALLGRLTVLYGARLPDQIVLLSVSPDRLTERLAAKRGGAPREIHEQSHLLALFQDGLAQCCQMLAQHVSTLRVHTIDTSVQTPAQTLDAVCRVAGLY